ncbi:hypothetical protein BKI52_37260 [marine bacterium AO1-C]|nr:hypothetical protein BKI52_37260 [marine bacterium AO1-C]
MKKALCLPFFFLLLCLDFQSFAQKKPTLEQIMSYSFPSNLIASKKSEKLAWVQNKEGVRNVWFAQMKEKGRAFDSKQLTNYTEDDGQAISQLTFTRKENALIYVRGGGPNNRGEIPNPALIPDGAFRQIWRISLNGSKEIDLLTTGNNPTICPAQDMMAFTRGGQIWVYDLKLNVEKPLLKTRGGAGELRWSPDGKKLGFSSFRGDHAFIGIYDLAKKQLNYISPSVDNDGSLVWSPDGAQIAFLRIPNERKQLIFEPHREGLPYAIWVHSFITGKTQQVWQAKPGVGSVFRNISASNQLFWTANNQIVFPYEGDGWTHLYAISAKGGTARLLTPGKFELQFVSLSADRREILYSGNQNDLDRQHIWRINVRKGKPVQLTTGKGVEWNPVMTPKGRLAYLASTGTLPAQAYVTLSPNKVKPLITNALKDYPAKSLVEPQQIVFNSKDGLKIHAQLFMPQNIRKGDKRPAVLFFHGGSRRQMLLGFHHRGYYHNNYAMNQYLASKGYIVMSVNYRSGIGYGMKFREALNYGATGASEFQDVLAAGHYLQSRTEVDAKRIGLWGGSYGGYLTALGLARASDMFAAGVDIHGVHDWNVIVKNFIPSYNPSARKKFAKLAYDSSPIAFIKTWRSPVLLIHGDDDRNVPFSETVDLAESLRKQKVVFEQLVFPDEVHGFLLHRNWVNAYKAAADFFDRKLKKK